MKIRVYTADIKNGVKGNRTKCPIALAVKRVFPKRRVSVMVVGVFINRKYYPFTDAVSSWVMDFDSGNKVRPFILEI